MPRFARHLGDDLAKYFILTGTTLQARDAFELGIVTKLVAPAEVDAAIQDLLSLGKPLSGVLEGGYSLENLRSGVAAFLEALS